MREREKGVKKIHVVAEETEEVVRGERDDVKGTTKAKGWFSFGYVRSAFPLLLVWSVTVPHWACASWLVG